MMKTKTSTSVQKCIVIYDATILYIISLFEYFKLNPLVINFNYPYFITLYNIG